MTPSISFGPTSGLIERLAAYLPMLALPDPSAAPARLTGTVLHFEIEGFEALAESLIKSGREGGDVLARVLNSYYSPLIGLIGQHGGDILEFNGHNLVVFFNSQPVARAASLALLETAGAFPAVQTPEGRYTTKARAGIGQGELEMISLGSDVAGRSLVFSGPALELARQMAQEAQWQTLQGGAESLDETAPIPLASPNFGDEEPLSVFNRLSPYLPRPVAQRLKSGQNWPGEFRRVVNIYVQLSGLDLTRPTDLAALQGYYLQVQRVCARLDGRVHAVLPASADKLVCLHLTFGALLSNNDDAEHALSTALALRDLPTPSGDLPTIGVASGNVFTGSVGNERRQSYIVLGRVVDVGSQFAEIARQGDGPGTLLVDRFTRERVGLSFLFGEDLLLNLPGWPMPVKTSRLLAPRPATLSLTSFLRDHPVKTQPLDDSGLMLEEALGGHRQVTLLRSEDMATPLVQRWIKSGGQGAVGRCMLNASHVPYLAWSGLLSGLIGLHETDSRTAKMAKLSQALVTYAPNYIPFASWLNQLIGLAQEEPGFRQRLSGPQREQFADLVLELLRGKAASTPTMLIFHDLQWSDEPGLVLLEQAVRELDTSALLFCLTASTSDRATDKRLLALLGEAR